MNAVKYGSRTDDTVTVVCTCTDDGIRIDVADRGARGTSVTELQTIIACRECTHTPHQTSGRGLALFLQQWTDHFFITQNEYGGLTVSFTKAHPHA